MCALATTLILQGCSSDDDEAIQNETAQNKETTSTINSHEYVDLGLSVMWATCNVGASSPSDYGNYYAWGETETKSEYTSSNSITYDKDMENIAGNVDYDVACADWGNPWRMPTEDEMEELISKCQWTWTKMGGHEGYKVIGPNGNSIFLPAAGWCAGDLLYEEGEDGRYWSSTPDESDSSGAYGISFDSRDSNGRDYGRNWGYSIRPVSSETPTGTLNGHDYIDLGLTSGLKWATCNVGASSPSDYGDYFAWGNTKDYTISTEPYTGTDNISGNSDYDAATANWGNVWRIPTKEEIDELIEECSWVWTKTDDINGYKVTSSNGNSIFLPAAGYYGTSLISAGRAGMYWSSSPYESYSSFAYYLEFQNGYFGWNWSGGNYGQSIRPVSGERNSVTQSEEEETLQNEVPTGTLNGHDYIDLGLSVMWATCNVGASSPSNYGDYFIWGNTKDYTISTEPYTGTDNISGNPDYDAATANWGSAWRLPTEDEIDELIDKCQWKWTTIDSLNGIKVTGPSGKSIFLPAAGHYYETSLMSVGGAGMYWSSSNDNTFFGFESGFFSKGWCIRSLGLSIRPVSE